MTTLYTEPDDSSRLTPASRFRFHCHPGLACFNQCCRLPTIILRPYDILRLSRHLGLRTGDFLDRYTLVFREEVSNLPLRLLALTETGCPFLHPTTGCTVYPARPAACRLFPVTQGSRLTPEGVEDLYFLRRLPFCQGFEADQEWTLASWEADQDLAANERQDRVWKDVLVLLGVPGRPPTDIFVQELFTRSFYDLDRLRLGLAEASAPLALALTPEARERLQTDDEALLAYGGRDVCETFGLRRQSPATPD